MVGVARRVAVPLLAAAAVALALPRLSADPPAPPPPPPEALAPLVDDPFETGADPAQVDVLQALWSSWDDDLTARGAAGPLPAEVAALSFDEALYVLLSVRAAQAAAAAREPGAGEDLGASLRRQGLTGSTAEVTVTRVPGGQPGCVAVSYVDEPRGRAYYGLLEPQDDPGPEPLSPLEDVLLRTARVGIAETDAATCGLGGVAYSSGAQQALRALEVELLTD